jgi:pSer/pThr/pTyr-binding forkhead associated (FHA) protein
VIESVELLIKQPGHADRTVRLPEGATRMGRAEDNEVVLADVGVSRRHAQVYVSRTEVTVEDLGSGNGTYYNGYRVQSQAISDGDEVVVDPFVLQFRIRGKGAARNESPPKAPSAANLEVVVGTGLAGTNYPISSRGLSIGRSEDRDVVIPDPAASRHHAQISAQGGDYVLRDMGSSNGIYVNGVRVRECTLADGDMLRIGNTEMRFGRFDQGSAPAAASSQDRAPIQPSPTAPSPAWRESSPAPASEPSYPPPAPRRSPVRSILAVAFGAVFLIMLFMVVVLVVVLVVLVYFRWFYGPTVTSVPARPPRWELKVPAGLPNTPDEQLLASGQSKLSSGDSRGALEDFYRVVVARPDNRAANTLAVTAGEYLVLESLQKAFSDHAAAELDRLAERDRLLKTVQKGPRTQALEAKNMLRRKYKEDPVVIEALELVRPDSLVALDRSLALAEEKLKVQKFDDAVVLYEKLLADSDDPARRIDVLKHLQLASTEVARQSSAAWTDAVVTERNDAAIGRQKFLALLSEHPSNASAQIHLGKR